VAPEADTDLDAIVIPSSVKLAGGIMIGAGLCAAITGLQALLFFRLPGIGQLMGPLALVLGGGCVTSGWGVVRGRSRSAVAGLVVTSLTCALAVAWIGLALYYGVLSLIAVAVLPLSAVAIFLVTLAFRQLKKIDAARDRLRAQGLDAGL
jgi:hypothetical protein